MSNEVEVKDQQSKLCEQSQLPASKRLDWEIKQQERVVKIFESINAIWGVRWCAHLNDPSLALTANNIWIDAIGDLSDKQVFNALKKLSRTCEYAPTIAQFRKAALNIVDADTAYHEAKFNHDTHAKHSNIAISHAATDIISWDWANLTEQELKAKFIAAYKHYVDKLLMGEL